MSAVPSRTAYHIPGFWREQLPTDIRTLDAGRSFIILAIYGNKGLSATYVTTREFCRPDRGGR